MCKHSDSVNENNNDSDGHENEENEPALKRLKTEGEHACTCCYTHTFTCAIVYTAYGNTTTSAHSATSAVCSSTAVSSGDDQSCFVQPTDDHNDTDGNDTNPPIITYA